MSDTIDKLKAIVQKADFTDEQKEGYLQSLDGLSKVKVPEINEALAQLLPEAEKNPAKIREFMWGMEKVLRACVRGGEAGVKQLLGRQIAAGFAALHIGQHDL